MATRVLSATLPFQTRTITAVVRRSSPSFARRTRLQLPQRVVSTRNMASSTTQDPARPAITTPPAGKCEFLIVVPDKPGMAQKRLEVRPKHFEGLQAAIETGAFKMGGAALNDVPEGADATKWDFHGSTLVVVAESAEECRELLRKDIYSTSGVWDVDNAQIWPVKIAFRHP